MKHRPIILSLALAALLAQAQVVTSPYSKIGYGQLTDNASGIQRSMGGVGYAMQNGRAINVMNPASYSQVDSLTFLWDVGVDFTNLWSKENGKHGYNFGGGLDYLTAQFRITNHLGGSFGIVPYASVGYSFGGSIDNGTESQAGNGSINQLYLGAGYEPFKGLSLGANISYLFGTTNRQVLVASESNTYFSRVMEVRDWNLQLGLQYAWAIGAKHRFVLGLSYQPRKSFHGHTWGTSADTQDSQPDTVGYTSLKGKFEQANSMGVGLSYTYNRKFTGELDFTYQDWSKAKYRYMEGFEAANTQLNDRWKLAAGFQYTPNRRGSYVGAMAFRVGAFVDHDYISVTGNDVKDYGLTAGIGLPVPNGKTTVNLGFEWKHRYTTPNPLITENYFNITLSVNFNELWFWKSRIR